VSRIWILTGSPGSHAGFAVIASDEQHRTKALGFEPGDGARA
jgi:hypothetical protein